MVACVFEPGWCVPRRWVWVGVRGGVVWTYVLAVAVESRKLTAATMKAPLLESEPRITVKTSNLWFSAIHAKI